MEALCRTEHFSEVIANNPVNRGRLLSIGVSRFIAVMSEWRRSFYNGAEYPVIGISPAELRSLSILTCVIPSNDRVHPREPGRVAHRLMPNAEIMRC
jgi:hypothetical protein